MSQYQNFCFSKKKNVNPKTTLLGIGTEIAPIQFNLKTNIGKKLHQPPVFLKGVGKDLSRIIKSPFLPLKCKCPSDGLFLRFKRAYPRVRNYKRAGHRLDVHKQQAQKTIDLKRLNFYTPMALLWARSLKNFNSSVSDILVKPTKDIPNKSTLNLTKKFNKQVISLTSKYFVCSERKNLCLSHLLILGLDGAYFTSRKEKQNFFYSRQKLRSSLFSSIKREYVFTQMFKLEEYRVTVKYITKSLIKNIQNLPISIVIIYLNMLSRIWPFFSELVLKHNHLFFKAPSAALPRTELFSRCQPPLFIKGVSVTSFYSGLREKNCNQLLPFQPKIGSNSSERLRLTPKLINGLDKNLTNKNRSFYTDITENKTIKSRLKLRGYFNNFILKRLQPYSQFFYLQESIVKGQRSSNKIYLRNKSLWAWNTKLNKQWLTKRESPQNGERKFNKKASLSYSGMACTYLTLWQLIKKKQNQNSLYSLFTKYWLITKVSSFFIKLKNQKKPDITPTPFINSGVGLARSKPFLKGLRLKIKDKCYANPLYKSRGLTKSSLYLVTKSENYKKDPFFRTFKPKLFSKTLLFKLSDYNSERHLLASLMTIRLKNIKWLYLTEKTDKIKFIKNSLTNKSTTKTASKNALETSIAFDPKYIGLVENTSGVKSTYSLCSIGINRNSITLLKNCQSSKALKKMFLDTYYF